MEGAVCKIVGATVIAGFATYGFFKFVAKICTR